MIVSSMGMCVFGFVMGCSGWPMAWGYEFAMGDGGSGPVVVV